MSGPPLPQYLRDLLEDLRRRLKPGRKKPQPPEPEEDVEFWRMLDLFLESARREGINISMKTLADMLNVGYQALLNRYRMWNETKSQLESMGLETPPPPGGGGDVTIIPPHVRQPPQQPPAEARPGETIEINPQVQLAMAKAALDVMKKRGEQITKDFAEELIKLGLHVFDRYAEWCHKHDFKNLKDCVDYVFKNFDSMEQENEELKTRLGELEEKYEHLKKFAQRLFAKTLGQPDPERVIGVVGAYIDEIMASCLDPDTAYAIAYRLLELLDRLLSAYVSERVAAT